MTTRTEKVFARLTPSLNDKVDAARGDKDKSSAVRDALEFSAESGVLSLPPEQLKSAADIVRAALNATATFSAAAHPILAENYALNCEIHRDWLITEVAESDLTFVLNIARAIDANQAGVDSALTDRFDRFFSANPGAEIYEIARQDLIWLELRRGAMPGQKSFVSYVHAAVERATVKERFLWHRRLLSELVAQGVAYTSLFAWNDAEKFWRLIDKPRLREAIDDGVRTLEVGDPITPPRSRAPARRPLPNPLQGKTMDGSDA